MSSGKGNKNANINNNYLNFVFLLSCICLVIVGGILASNDTIISSTFADKGVSQNKNDKSKEDKSSNFKEKKDSSDKRYIGDKGSQNHKKEKSRGKVKPIDNKKKKSSGEGKPIENEQDNNNIQPQPVQRAEPIIITNTVTTSLRPNHLQVMIIMNRNTVMKVLLDLHLSIPFSQIKLPKVLCLLKHLQNPQKHRIYRR